MAKDEPAMACRLCIRMVLEKPGRGLALMNMDEADFHVA